MDVISKGTLDLSKRGLKKIEKALPEESKNIVNLILDHNELQRLDNIDSFSRVENLSICNNFLLRMHGVSRLSNIRVMALNNNGILQIEGLKDFLFLKVLKLAGNNIKSIEHLNHNIHLEELDLSSNQIAFIADISYLKNLKNLNLERNRIIDLGQCDRYLPHHLEHLGLAHNNIQDLNEVSHMVHLNKLETFTIQGNPCVSMTGKDKIGFDYRPFVLNWIMSVKSIDGYVVSAIESLKAEWLYSQGKGRHHQPGQHQDLCEYLASTCPLTADALDTEDQKKLRLILSKAQHHQQQLKDHTSSPIKSRLQSPRMQSRISPRHMGRSPDRLTSSYHSAVTKCSSPQSQMSMSCSGEITSQHSGIPQAMSQSFDSPGLIYSLSEKQRKILDVDKEMKNNVQEPTMKPVNHSLEAASKMVPVPESLMSPDYHDPMYDIQRNIQKSASNHSSHSSNSSTKDFPDTNDKQKTLVSRSLRNSPKATRSATSSPKLKAKVERKNSLAKSDSKSSDNESRKNSFNTKINGVTNHVSKDNIDKSASEDGEHIALEKLEIIKLASNQRRQKKMSAEAMAAVMIQKMWRGYRSRNLNKDTLRILHEIQAARAREHIQRLTCDMQATKAALESERKIQQLQMQAISALWKKVSTIQSNDTQKHKNPDIEHKNEVLRQLTDTCCNLQAQVVELQGCMQEVLRAVSTMKSTGAPVATQTDISAVLTPQEERSTWLRRPQSLPISTTSVPAGPAPMTPQSMDDTTLQDNISEMESNLDETNAESLHEEKSLSEIQSITDNDHQTRVVVEMEKVVIVD